LQEGGIAQIFKDLSNPLSLICKPQVGGSIPLASSISHFLLAGSSSLHYRDYAAG